MRRQDRRRARGLDSGPSTSRNSATDPGQPCETSSGSASGSGERAVEEMDALTVDLGDGGSERVEALLLRVPVVVVLPVLQQRLEVAAARCPSPNGPRQADSATVCGRDVRGGRRAPVGELRRQPRRNRVPCPESSVRRQMIRELLDLKPTGDDRGLVLGTMHAQDGRHVASFTQELVIRAACREAS